MTTLTLTTKQIGRFDNASRYVIASVYQTESSSAIRAPSRAFPFSEYKHVFTKKVRQTIGGKIGS